MQCIRSILNRLLEYRVINLPDGSTMWRSEDGTCNIRDVNDVVRTIGKDDYYKLRSGNINLSPSDYLYPPKDMLNCLNQ